MNWGGRGGGNSKKLSTGIGETGRQIPWGEAAKIDTPHVSDSFYLTSRE